MINAVFALKSFELEYGHHGHFWASHLTAAPGCDSGGAATLEAGKDGGGDKCELNSAIAVATRTPIEGTFLIFFSI